MARALMTERIRLECRAAHQDIPLLKRQTKALLAQVERQIAELHAAISDQIAAQAESFRKFGILCSIPGIGN